jgi:hypothetical protein
MLKSLSALIKQEGVLGLWKGNLPQVRRSRSAAAGLLARCWPAVGPLLARCWPAAGLPLALLLRLRLRLRLLRLPPPYPR